jgi:hypothetical protein
MMIISDLFLILKSRPTGLYPKRQTGLQVKVTTVRLCTAHEHSLEGSGPTTYLLEDRGDACQSVWQIRTLADKLNQLIKGHLKRNTKCANQYRNYIGISKFRHTMPFRTEGTEIIELTVHLLYNTNNLMTD